ncbi:MAG: hypothetical protein HUU23_03755 [Caldilineales bacterium]|nr:hypothetical protein [Caldilineales bacterium]
MTTSEERQRVLRMIADGAITAEEGVRLLEALAAVSAAAAPPPGQSAARWFRVRVTDLNSGRDKVNINIPIGLVNVGLKMGARFVGDVEGVNWQDLAAAVQAGQTGKILEADDLVDGERVEIFVE